MLASTRKRWHDNSFADGIGMKMRSLTWCRRQCLIVVKWRIWAETGPGRPSVIWQNRQHRPQNIRRRQTAHADISLRQAVVTV